MLVHTGHHVCVRYQLSEGRCTRSPTKRAAGLKACPCEEGGEGGGKRNAGDANSARAERASESLVHEVVIIKCLHRAGGTADHVLYIRISKHAAAAASEQGPPPLGGAHIDHGPQQQHTPSSERASLLFVLSLAGKRGGAGGQWGRVLRVVHDCVISHVRAVPSTTSSVLCIRLVRQRRASY